ncbi:MAG TPA: glucoamylase family protein [Candidatus Acidoferrales bacterium]|nr:glucoamylase family protein [Candidatus Acidoferrales bacterium]
MKRRNDNRLSRRDLLKGLAGIGMLMPMSAAGALATHTVREISEANPLPAGSPLTARDDVLLEQIERANFLFFWEQTNPTTGLTRDRFNVRSSTAGNLGSIAATGFGLTAICIGEKRGYVSYEQASERALAAMRFLWRKLPHQRGFFYHWADVTDGRRMERSEVSSIDTAILLCGILTCRAHFRHSEINELAQRIFNRVDWGWLSEDTLILPMGWTPETGFLHYRWDNYCELMMLYLLGLGSETHPLPPGTWEAWKRSNFDSEGVKYIGSFAPLFVHQYSQAWFDFRGKRDQYADYYENSILATEAHRRFCLNDLARQFPDYSEQLWGITASDSQNGYTVWGGPPKSGPIDGTIVPCATAGSLPFLPEPVMRVLHNIHYRYGVGTWSRYGFVDAFNPLINWYDSDVVGIDTGITMVMVENARTGWVWETFMRNPEAQRGMERAGFKTYSPAPYPIVRPEPVSHASAGNELRRASEGVSRGPGDNL